MKRAGLLIGLIIIFMMGTIWIRVEMLLPKVKTEVPTEGFILPKLELTKAASVGYYELLSDFYWLKAIQYFGDERNYHTDRLKHLFPLVNLITDISPLFEYAYRFGGVTISLLDTNGDLAKTILIKGVQNTPDSWRIPYLLGYIEYYVLNNPKMASVFYDLAGVVAVRMGEPEMIWLRNLAEKILLDLEDTDVMIPVLEKMYREEKDPVLKEKYFTRFRMALQRRDFKFLTKKIEEFKKMYGRYPSKLEELVEKSVISIIPVEPFNGRYDIMDGKIVVVPK
ncbi:MAG: hypothetical protein N2746_04275 [Deltaproteobacteria bacterium]|nr:hypothetical protein [Deltaproteobacteria bacterium]